MNDGGSVRERRVNGARLAALAFIWVNDEPPFSLHVD